MHRAVEISDKGRIWSTRVAAIVSLEGATWNAPARCTPARPVAVLEVHGDADEAFRGKTTSFLRGLGKFASCRALSDIL